MWRTCLSLDFHSLILMKRADAAVESRLRFNADRTKHMLHVLFTLYSNKKGEP